MVSAGGRACAGPAARRSHRRWLQAVPAQSEARRFTAFRWSGQWPTALPIRGVVRVYGGGKITVGLRKNLCAEGFLAGEPFNPQRRGDPRSRRRIACRSRLPSCDLGARACDAVEDRPVHAPPAARDQVSGTKLRENWLRRARRSRCGGGEAAADSWPRKRRVEAERKRVQIRKTALAQKQAAAHAPHAEKLRRPKGPGERSALPLSSAWRRERPRREQAAGKCAGSRAPAPQAEKERAAAKRKARRKLRPKSHAGAAPAPSRRRRSERQRQPKPRRQACAGKGDRRSRAPALAAARSRRREAALLYAAGRGFGRNDPARAAAALRGVRDFKLTSETARTMGRHFRAGGGEATCGRRRGVAASYERSSR